MADQKLYALLTLDLHEVTDKQRAEFDEALANMNWVKIPDIGTAWKAVFKAGVSRERAVEIAKMSVTAAAKKAKIASIDAAAQVGGEAVDVF